MTMLGETPEDPLHPANVEVVFEGRPGKAYVSMLDYLALFEKFQEEKEKALTHESKLRDLSEGLMSGLDPWDAAENALNHVGDLGLEKVPEGPAA